jgi:hydrogenase/urease accessory protein HupE
MNQKPVRALMAAAMLLTGTSAADAHIVAARLGDFYMGASHPLTDLQDVVLWIATGVLAGTLGASKGAGSSRCFRSDCWSVCLSRQFSPRFPRSSRTRQ